MQKLELQLTPKGYKKMRIADLLNSINHREFYGNPETLVNGICFDSRKIEKGNMFIALKGEVSNGNLYISDALNAGASGIISEDPCPVGFSGSFWLSVKNDRIALAQASVAFYRNPSSEMLLTGITGTNGKTTTAHFLSSIYRSAGLKSGNIGTIEYDTGEHVIVADRTTPESPYINSMLRKMADRGIRHCVMEVSSHGAALHRISGLVFATAVFTNLTRDHLDYHESMDNYFNAKLILFKGLNPNSHAVVNVDDPHAEKIIKDCSGQVFTYGFTERADMVISVLKQSTEGSEFKVSGKCGSIHLKTSMIGMPNIYNASAAVTAAITQGLERDVIAEGIRTLSRVRGRFESIPNDRGICVIVDFAHTDDALERLLNSVSSMTSGKVIAVFGCGGDRDKGKRKLMGKCAGKNSGFVILTSDNPRSEDPEKILDEIEVGVIESGQSSYCRIADRTEAIRKALCVARKGDSVVIAGKGHETYQLIGSRKIPFEDRHVVESLLKEEG